MPARFLVHRGLSHLSRLTSRFAACCIAIAVGISAGSLRAGGTAAVTVESKAAPIAFAGDEIRGALRKAGWTIGDLAGKPAVSITLAEPDGQGAAESFEITATKAGESLSVRVRGKDVRGVMYGGLDVAEQISFGRDPGAIESRKAAAFLPIRALKFNIPLAGNAYLSEEDQAHSAWFYDLDYWREFMRFLAYHRYNMLTFWNSHPYDQMVRLAKYPEATSLSPEKLDESIAFFHKLFGMARDYGLDTSLVTWNIHCSKAFQKAHNVKDGQDSPLIRDYQKECIRTLLTEYPELGGVGTCPGENMGRTAEWRENWIRDTYFKGIEESGRKDVPFIHRYWGAEPAAAVKMLNEARYPGQILLDIKFNGEHMYSSTTPHPEERGWLTQNPKPYKLFWHLRNDCIFQLRWGDPDFAAAVVRNCAGPDSAGFVMGSEVEVPGVDRIHTPQTVGHKTWKYEFEKNWTRFGIWGRAGYDPDEPHDYWIACFAQRFGKEAAPAAFAALQNASKIIPLNTSFHWNYMNGDWYPEGSIGSWNTSDGIPFENYRDNQIYHNVLEWIFTHPIDTTYECIPYFVADLLSGSRPNGLTPLEVADSLDASARACEKERLTAASRVSAGKGEWECTEMDLKALESLGHYYAAKTRGATELMHFLATGDKSHQQAAVDQLEKALGHWKNLAEVTSAHYITHEVWLVGQFDWKRYTKDVEHDIQIAREISPWPCTEQTWEYGSKTALVKSRCWSADNKAYPGIDKWVAAFNERAVGRPPANAGTPLGVEWVATTLKYPGEGMAVLGLRTAAVATAKIDPSECTLAGAGQDQFVIGPVHAGENRLELHFAGRVLSPPQLTREALLAKDSVFLDAASGQLTPPMALKEMAGVAGGKVVWAPTGKGRGDNPPGGKPVDNGWVTYKVTIPKDGQYAVRACVWWHDTAANSFFYAWDKAEPKVLGNDDFYAHWHWVRTEPAKLAAGKHTLTVRTREEGAVLGALIVAPDELAPADPAEAGAMLDKYFERLSAPHHLKFASLDEWKARRAELRKLVLRDLNLDPLPGKLPLNVTYGGELDRGDYTVKRVYWQTWPEVYASGYLYIPKTPGKHPAILNPHGHWANGARHPVVQSRCIGLAQKGYVNLAVDSVHIPEDSYLIGVSPLTIMMFNAIRGLDLLESLPEVDAARIGCTGASGGGQQTMFLMGIDDRLAAAAPVVMVTYYRRIMSPAGFPHCHCNILPGIVRDVDEPEMTATYAPKPTLYECVTGDWTREFPKEEFPELRAVHALYGAAGDVAVQQWQSDHDYSKPMRERMYAFFNKYLRKVDDPAEAVEPELKTESLETLSALDKPPAGAKPQTAVVDWYKARYAFKAVEAKDASGWRQYQDEVRRSLAGVLGDVAAHGRLVGSPQSLIVLGHKATRLMVASEPEIAVPVVLVVPDERKAAGGSRTAPLVIVIADGGARGVIDEQAALVESLLAGGAAVAVADVRLTGELARGWQWDCIMWGRPEVGMAVTDVRAVLDVLAGQAGVDAKRAALIGLGKAGLSALFVGAMEHRVTAVAVPELGATYLAGRKSPVIANLMRVGDLPQVAAAIAPHALMLGAVKVADYAYAAGAYRGLEAEGKLRMNAEPVGVGEVAAWALRQCAR